HSRRRLYTLFQRCRERIDKGGSLMRRHPRPGTIVKRLAGGGDSAMNVVLLCAGDAGIKLSRGRGNHLNWGVPRGRHPFPANEEPIGPPNWRALRSGNGGQHDLLISPAHPPFWLKQAPRLQLSHDVTFPSEDAHPRPLWPSIDAPYARLCKSMLGRLLC